MIRELAIKYWNEGWNVIPVGSHKRPIIPSWKRWVVERQTLPDVEAMPWDQAAGVAGICGFTYSALDLDTKDHKSGAPLPPKTIEFMAKLPKTRVHTTMNNGRHFVYKTRQKAGSTDKFRKQFGIEVQGIGNYIVLPGSMNGAYHSDEQPILEIADLEQLVHEVAGELGWEEPKKRKTDSIKAATLEGVDPWDAPCVRFIAENMIPKGGRHNTISKNLAVLAVHCVKETERQQFTERLVAKQEDYEPQDILGWCDWVDQEPREFNHDEVIGYIKQHFPDFVCENCPLSKTGQQIRAKLERFSEADMHGASNVLSQNNIIPSILYALEEVSGEESNKALLYLLNLGKQSVEIQGKSSSGKNTIVDAVLDCFPHDSWKKITSSSDKALRYLNTSIRTLYMAERRFSKKAGEESESEFDVKLVISEGKLCAQVVSKDPDTNKWRVEDVSTSIENVIMTTTDVALPDELENRLWVLNTDESVAANLWVIRWIADRYTKVPSKKLDRSPERKVLRAAMKHTWQTAPKGAPIIPYYNKLIPLLDAFAHDTRVRRDTIKLAALIQTMALLHWQTRPKVEDCVVALPIDFYRVWKLGEEAILGTFSPDETIREREIKTRLKAMFEGGKEVEVNAVMIALGVKKRAAQNWLRRLGESGWIVNLSDPKKKGVWVSAHSARTAQVHGLRSQIVISTPELTELTQNWLGEHTAHGASGKVYPDKILQEEAPDTWTITLPYQLAQANDKPVSSPKGESSSNNSVNSEHDSASTENAQIMRSAQADPGSTKEGWTQA